MNIESLFFNRTMVVFVVLALLLIVLDGFQRPRISTFTADSDPQSSDIDYALKFVQDRCPQRKVAKRQPVPIIDANICITFCATQTELPAKVDPIKCATIVEQNPMRYYSADPHEEFRLSENGDCFRVRPINKDTCYLESQRFPRHFLGVNEGTETLCLQRCSDPTDNNLWQFMGGLDRRVKLGLSLRHLKTDRLIYVVDDRLKVEKVNSSQHRQATFSWINSDVLSQQAEGQQPGESDEIFTVLLRAHNTGSVKPQQHVV